MTGLLLLLAGTALVALTAVAVTALLRPEGRLDAAVTAGVVAVTSVVGTALLAGVAGLLRAEVLLALHAVQAVAAATLLRRRGPWPALVRRRAGADLPAVRAAPWEWAVVVLAAGALGWQLMVALVLPPFAYDALSYHLPNVAHWVRTESLAPSPLVLCCAYYPSNPGLVTAWQVALLGRDALVGTVQIAAALLAAAAVAGIARTAGLRRRSAAAAGALMVLTPALLAQAPTAYVDVLLAALVLAGLHGLARFAATARPSRLVVPALCAGILTGTKGTGLLWAIGLAATAAVLLGLHVRHGRLRLRPALTALAGVAGACLLLGGWWYARSAVDTGNPLHPFEVVVAGRTVFDGPLTVAEVLTRPQAGADAPWPVAVLRSWASDLLPVNGGSYDYQQRLGGLGPVWAWLGLPLLLPLAILLWRRRSPALAVLVPVVAVLLVQPYRWWARFTLPLAAVGVVAVLLAVEQLRPGWLRRGLQTATTVLAVLGAALVLVEVDPASRAQPLPASRVLALVGAPAEERTVGRLLLEEYRFVDDIPPRATVVVDLEAPEIRFTYPLFGPGLERTVLRSGPGEVPADAWVVTSAGRELDEAMTAARGAPSFERRGIRVYPPRT